VCTYCTWLRPSNLSKEFLNKPFIERLETFFVFLQEITVLCLI